MANFVARLRTAAWTAAAITAAALSWLFGLGTCLAQIDSCTWVQRHAPLRFLAIAGIAIVLFYLVHLLPRFSREAALHRTIRLAWLVLVPWLFGWLVSGPSYFGAINRARQKRTMADMRDIAIQLDAYRSQHGEYPEAESLSELLGILDWESGMPLRDGWNTPFVFQSNRASYYLVSYTLCGRPECPSTDSYEPGPPGGYEPDIVVVDGAFVRYPEGTRPEVISRDR
jgi:hypothetical protein